MLHPTMSRMLAEASRDDMLRQARHAELGRLAAAARSTTHSAARSTIFSATPHRRVIAPTASVIAIGTLFLWILL